MPATGKLYGQFGTAPYMCPEMLNGDWHNEKADIWSLGATTYLILFGEFPYMPAQAEPTAMKELIRVGHPGPKFKRINGDDPPSDVATNFVRALLNRKPECRLSAVQALKLAFVSVEKESTLKRGLTASRLGPILTQAKDHAQEFKKAVDPTVQRSLDELLEKLQDPRHKEELFRRSFSWNKDQVQAPVCPLPADERICRRAERLSTHSGVLSQDFKDVVSTMDFDGDSDAESEYSVESESSFTWEPPQRTFPDPSLRSLPNQETRPQDLKSTQFGTKKMKDIVNHFERGAEDTKL